MSSSRVSFLAGDVLALIAFGLFARLAHRGEMPFSVAGWANTTWPFLVGCAVAWVILTVRGMNPARLIPAGVLVWVLSVAGGLGIWWIHHGRIPHWSFVLVATIMSGLLLLGYRAVVGRAARR